MKIRGLLLSLAVLAALTGVLYWSNHRRPSGVAKPSETSPKILTLNQADIQKIAISKPGSSEIDLAKNAAGNWEMTSPKLTADQEAVRNLTGMLASLDADRLVDAKATDLGQYGLTHPTLTVRVTLKNGQTKTLLVGDTTPAGSDSYAELAGDPRVFTVASYTRSSLDKSPNDLRDKRLLTLQADKVSRLELLAHKQDIEFGRNQDAWQILKPRPLRADSGKIDGLLNALIDARMDLTGSQTARQLATAFASAKPVATVRMTGPSGTQQLEVRKNKDDYYAKSSIVAGVYKVSSDLGEALNKRLNNFRDKNLFDFGYVDPNSIQYQDGSTEYSLKKSGKSWLANGKKVGADSAEAFIGAVRDLSASSFPTSGFTKPVLDLSVTSNDGKRVEKVEIAKSGTNYIAKRDNDPSLYELDASAISDLRNAAGKLSPVTTASAHH